MRVPRVLSFALLAMALATATQAKRLKLAKPIEPAVTKPVAAVPSFEQRVLASHNKERLRVGVAPLVWSARLAADAVVWADYLAKSGKFEHSAPKSGKDGQGENLWSGSAGQYTLEEMVDGWIEERTNLTAGKFPNVSKTGNWLDVGHYTQLIWYSSAEVGCALGKGTGDDVLVCRYTKPGNWIGENPLGNSKVPITKITEIMAKIQ